MMGSYDLAFHIAGLPIIAGALVLFLIPWAQRTSKTTNVMIAVSEYNVDDDSNETLRGLLSVNWPKPGYIV